MQPRTYVAALGLELIQQAPEFMNYVRTPSAAHAGFELTQQPPEFMNYVRTPSAARRTTGVDAPVMLRRPTEMASSQPRPKSSGEDEEITAHSVEIEEWPTGMFAPNVQCMQSRQIPNAPRRGQGPRRQQECERRVSEAASQCQSRSHGKRVNGGKGCKGGKKFKED